MRVLVTGWPSFLHGEATAGDVQSMRRVSAALTAAGIPSRSAWSPVFRPGALTLEAADPGDFTHLVFACGPAHGPQVRWLHEKFAACRRIVVGVSVIDGDDAAVTGFHHVLARDSPSESTVDLAAGGTLAPVPVAGVVLAPGQAEYGARRQHDQVHREVTTWVNERDCAPVPLDTRLDGTDWRHCATPDQFAAILRRLDVVVSSRLHGVVFALRAGTPVLAVDPVAGGGKVSAQVSAWGWPALLTADQVCDSGGKARFARWWNWCLSDEASRHARTCAIRTTEKLTTQLVSILREDRANR
jgi:hypothetical protein